MAWVAVGLAAGAGGGLLMGKLKNDKAKQMENSDRNLAAETQRYSPWTGMHAGQIRNANSVGADLFGGALGGAMTGMSLASAAKGMGGVAQAPGVATAGGGGEAGVSPQEQDMLSDEQKFDLNNTRNYGAPRTVMG